MKVKINRNAAKELKKMLETEEAQGKMIRIFVTHMHGDHAHYGIDFDTPKEHDEIVKTDKGIDILRVHGKNFLTAFGFNTSTSTMKDLLLRIHPKAVTTINLIEGRAEPCTLSES